MREDMEGENFFMFGMSVNMSDDLDYAFTYLLKDCVRDMALVQVRSWMPVFLCFCMLTPLNFLRRELPDEGEIQQISGSLMRSTILPPSLQHEIPCIVIRTKPNDRVCSLQVDDAT